MLHVEWGTALYQLIVFTILFLMLRKFALRPLLGVMESRSQKIANDISAAEKSREEALKLIAEQRAELTAARADAQRIVENARITATKQADELVAKAKEESEAFKKSAQMEIASQRDQAMNALRDQVGALSIMLATKIIEKELDQNQQDKLVSDFLKEVGEVK